MLRFVAILFGIGFIFAGVVGFLPSFTPNNLLFGYFEVNAMHNIVHLASGVIAIMAATNLIYTIWYFRIFGLIYLLVSLLGFILHGDLSIVMTHFNLADNFLHLAIAVVALYFGFFAHKNKMR